VTLFCTELDDEDSHQLRSSNGESSKSDENNCSRGDVLSDGAIDEIKIVCATVTVKDCQLVFLIFANKAPARAPPTARRLVIEE
jgi:hypothetical protein